MPNVQTTDFLMNKVQLYFNMFFSLVEVVYLPFLAGTCRLIECAIMFFHILL